MDGVVLGEPVSPSVDGRFLLRYLREKQMKEVGHGSHTAVKECMTALSLAKGRLVLVASSQG